MREIKPACSQRDLAACRHTSKQIRNAHAAVRVSISSLLVQRDRWDTYWGPKIIIFFIRDIDDTAMAAVPAESCQSVAPRSPGARSGMLLDVGNRLRRMRGRFPLQIHLPRCISVQLSPPQNAIVCRYTLALLSEQFSERNLTPFVSGLGGQGETTPYRQSQ